MKVWFRNVYIKYFTCTIRKVHPCEFTKCLYTKRGQAYIYYIYVEIGGEVVGFSARKTNTKFIIYHASKID